jgi:uncharacterized membrane protein
MKEKLRKYWLTGILLVLSLFLAYWAWSAWQELLLLYNQLFI